MPQQELISVIMPVYNDEKYIREAIQSILNQTYSNIEFIIIANFIILKNYSRIASKCLYTFIRKNILILGVQYRIVLPTLS